MKISVIINTYNSQQHLEKCLDAVRDFDEIVICDMHSTDETISIAESYGCKIVYHEHTGFVEPARNFALSQSSNDWVLVVDSDELVSPQLREYLYDFLKQHSDQYSGLYIARKNYFMGRFMHGQYPDYLLRFMRRSKTDWAPTIHSTPTVDGNVTKIPSGRKELAFEHLADEGVAGVISKLNGYTTKEMIRREGQNPSPIGAISSITFRFFKMYILKGGFRDGRAGFVHAVLNSFYKFATIAKLWEMQTSRKFPSK